MGSNTDLSGEMISSKSSFSSILSEVMKNSDYLVGTELEGSGWDFGDWIGHDFSDIVYNDYGVLGEKFFNIPTINNKVLPFRIIEVDPKIFSIKDKKLRVNYIVGCADSELDIPAIVIATDADGQERILTQKLSVDINGILTKYFSNIKRNELVEDNDKNWAYFLKEVLINKQFLPNLYNPTEESVRDWLNLELSYPIGEEEILATELEQVNQEVLGILYTDFVV